MAEVEVTGEVVEWRGPAPYHFLPVPAEQSAVLRAEAAALSYGWGMLPVTVRIGTTDFTTSLWPKDGGYWLPLKDAARRSAGIALGDVVTAVLSTGGVTDAAALVALVRRIRAGEATSEEQEEAWLDQVARGSGHPRAIALVLEPEAEIGGGATPEQIVEQLLSPRRPARP